MECCYGYDCGEMWVAASITLSWRATPHSFVPSHLLQCLLGNQALILYALQDISWRWNWERCVLQLLTNNTKISLSVAFSISASFSLRLTNSRGILTPVPQHFHIIGLHFSSLPSKHDAPHPPFFSIETFFHTIYCFNYVFPLGQLLQDPSHLPTHPTLCSVSLSFKYIYLKTKNKKTLNREKKEIKTKTKTNKKKTKQKRPKQSKMKQKSTKHHWLHFVLANYS